MVKNSVGLDIGTNTIKIIELKESGGKAQIIRAEITGTPADLTERKKIISKLLSNFGINKKLLSIAVPGPSAYIKYITLPPLDASRTEQMMGYEAKQQILIPLKEVIWNYQVLSTKNTSKTNIVLVAAKLEAIRKLLENIRGTGINPHLIDYTPLASYNALKLSDSMGKETSVLVDIGAGSTSLNIETGGFLCWTRSIPTGGISLTASIEKAFGVTHKEAEKLKKEKGGAPRSNGDPKIIEAMAPTLNHLASEIERSLTFFQTELGGRDITRIILSGGGSLIKNIAPFFEYRLGVAVVTASPLKALLLPTPIISRGTEVFFTTAIGLALRPILKCPSKINLLPLNILKKKEFRTKKTYLIVSLILAILTSGIFHEFFAQNYRITKSHIAIIEANLEKYRRYESEMKGAKEEKRLAAERIEALKKLATKRVSLPSLFLELTYLLPNEASLKSFSFQDKIITVSGIAPLLPTITNFITKIKASPFFGKITTELAGEPGAHKFNFTINTQ